MQSPVVRYRRPGEHGRRCSVWQRGGPETARSELAGAARPGCRGRCCGCGPARRPRLMLAGRRGLPEEVGSRRAVCDQRSRSVAAYRTRARCRPADHRPAATPSPAATSPDPRPRALRLLLFRSVFGSFPSVASAGLRLQCRWPGVKFAPYAAAACPPNRQRADLTPGHRCCTPRADDATEGNGPQPPHKPQPLRLTQPPYGAAPVPRGSREPPPEAPAVDFRHPPHAAIAANTTCAQ